MLITLGIIGIVAALTIPQALVRINKQTTEVKLKKFYSVISQATDNAMVENGDWKNWKYTGAREFYDTYYKKQLAPQKVKYDGDVVYVVLRDGTCARMRVNGSSSYGNDINNIYWGISTDCKSTGTNEGTRYFELTLYNFKNANVKCNHNPHGCGWEGVSGYYSYWANRKEKAACRTDNYAWKSYECYLKFIQDGMQFSDDYKFYEHKVRKVTSSNYW